MAGSKKMHFAVPAKNRLVTIRSQALRSLQTAGWELQQLSDGYGSSAFVKHEGGKATLIELHGDKRVQNWWHLFDLAHCAIVAIDKGDINFAVNCALFAGAEAGNSESFLREVLQGSANRKGKGKVTDDELQAAMLKAGPTATAKEVRNLLSPARQNISERAIQQRIKGLRQRKNE